MRLARRILAAVLAAALVAACTAVDDAGSTEFEQPPAHSHATQPRPTPVRTPPPGPPAALPPAPPVAEIHLQIVEQVEALVVPWTLRNPEVGWSVLVADHFGRELVALDADVPRLPASTMKVVTAAASLLELGMAAGLPTHLEATAPLVGSSVMGDLVLVGAGDPALATEHYARWVYPTRPATRLDVLADLLLDTGVRRIGGDIVGSAGVPQGPSLAPGWPQRYLADLDARHAAVLSVDAGLRTIVTWPDVLVEGDDPVVPPIDSEGDAAPLVEVEPERVTVELVDDPTIHAAEELRRMLIERGIEVTGVARGGPHAPTVTRFGSLPGTPVGDLTRFALERSDNHLADGLFLALGVAYGRVSSWESGSHAVTRWLQRHGIASNGAVMVDGSGLSRENRLTVRQLVEVDRLMSSHPIAGQWHDQMAVMGRTGTLRRRLVGTVADGWFAGKTGSLRDVMSMSGTVIDMTAMDATADGARRLHLAVIVNEVEGEDRVSARRMMDELVLVIAAALQGCDVARQGPRPDDPDIAVADVSELAITC